MPGETPAISFGVFTLALDENINSLEKAKFVETSDNKTAVRSSFSGGTDGTTIGNTGDALNITLADNKYIDSVGRLRVSDVSLIASHCLYAGIRDLDFLSSIAGDATAVFNANAACVRLTCTTAATDSVIRQTRRYLSYSSGIGHSYGLALTVGAKKANVRQRWGHFDANDGSFFEQTATDLAVVVRSSATGSVVDTRIVQANFNIDKLDGTGISGINLNTAYHNKYTIDMSWYGAGRVRFGVTFNGQTFYCHEFDGSNVSALPYTRTPKLPIRFELTNLAETASATTMDVVCLSAVQESSAGFLETYNFSKSNERTAKNVGITLVPVISIRPADNFNGIANRTTIMPDFVQVLSANQDLLIKLILNPSITTASWGAVNAQSAAEFDVSSTAISGGIVVAEFYIPSTSEKTFDLSDFSKTLKLATNIAGTSGDIFTLAAVTVSGNSNVLAVIGWKEFQ